MSLERVLQHCINELRDIIRSRTCMDHHWKINNNDVIGEGKFGVVSTATNKGNVAGRSRYVVKEQVANERFHNEVSILRSLEKTDTTAKMMDSWVYGDFGYIVLQRLVPIPADQDVYMDVVHLLKTIHRRNITMLDVKRHNCMQSKDGKVLFIDFGISENFSDTIATTRRSTFWDDYFGALLFRDAVRLDMAQAKLSFGSPQMVKDGEAVFEDMTNVNCSRCKSRPRR